MGEPSPPATASQIDSGESDDGEAARLDAIVAHWDAYTDSWSGGTASGTGFIVANNMYDAGPEACGVDIPDGRVRADRSSIVRLDDWLAPRPEALAHESDEIYELLVVPEGGEPLTAHIAFVDGRPRHYFGCHPEWLGAWEGVDADGSRHWTWVEYAAADDQFYIVYLDELASAGPCAGGPALLDGLIDSPSPDSLVASWQSWCGPPGEAVPDDLRLVERDAADGDTEFHDDSSGLTFAWVGDRFDVTTTYDVATDALAVFGEPFSRSERTVPVVDEGN